MWLRELDESNNVYVNWRDPAHESNAQCLAAELAQVWEEHYDGDGSLYLYERVSGETAWELPQVLPVHDDWSGGGDEQFASEWYACHDEESGYTYYQNAYSGETAWELPHGATVVNYEDASNETAAQDESAWPEESCQQNNDGLYHTYAHAHDGSLEELYYAEEQEETTTHVSQGGDHVQGWQDVESKESDNKLSQIADSHAHSFFDSQEKQICTTPNSDPRTEDKLFSGKEDKEEPIRSEAHVKSNKVGDTAKEIDQALLLLQQQKKEEGARLKEEQEEQEKLKKQRDEKEQKAKEEAQKAQEEQRLAEEERRLERQRQREKKLVAEQEERMKQDADLREKRRVQEIEQQEKKKRLLEIQKAESKERLEEKRRLEHEHNLTEMHRQQEEKLVQEYLRLREEKEGEKQEPESSIAIGKPRVEEDGKQGGGPRGLEKGNKNQGKRKKKHARGMHIIPDEQSVSNLLSESYLSKPATFRIRSAGGSVQKDAIKRIEYTKQIVRVCLEKVFNDMLESSGCAASGRMSRGKFLGAIVKKPAVLNGLRYGAPGFRHLFRPRTFVSDFLAADRTKSGWLDAEQFVAFCLSHRQSPPRESTFRPYHKRVGKRTRKEFETLLITITIPALLNGKVDDSLGRVPYAHFSRRREWSETTHTRRVEWEKHCLAHKEMMRVRRAAEATRVKKWDSDKKLLDEREARARRKFRAQLAKANEQILRQETAKFLSTSGEGDALKQLKSSSFNSEGEKLGGKSRKNGLFSMRSGRKSSSDKLDKNDDSLPIIQGASTSNLEDAAGQKACIARLSSAGRSSYETWRQQKTLELEENFEAKVDERIADFEMRERERVKEERSRRKRFAQETKRLEREQAVAEETFEVESNACADVERELQRCEDRAFGDLQRQRALYLDTVTHCYDRPLMRRLAWESTLKEKGEISRTCHLVRDELTQEKMVMLTFACSRRPGGLNPANTVVDMFRVFQKAGTPTLISRAERQDDRVGPRFSKYLVELRHVFAHRVKSWHQIFVLAKYYPGGRLSDVIRNMYGDYGKRVDAPEGLVMRWADQLAKAVRALHRNGFCHRGIDPGCIFLDSENNLRLGLPKDFWAVDVGDGRASHLTILTQYTAPENLAAKSADTCGSNFSQASAADIWSLGAVLYHLATGSPLPRHFVLARLVAAPRVRRFGRWLRDFLRMTLQQRSKDRGDITDVVDFLNDQGDNLLLDSEEVKETLARLYQS